MVPAIPPNAPIAGGISVLLSGGGTASQIVSGTAPPNSIVAVYRNSGIVGSTMANSAGRWSLTLTTLTNGDVISAASAVLAVVTITSIAGGGPNNTADLSDPNNAYLAALTAA